MKYILRTAFTLLAGIFFVQVNAQDKKEIDSLISNRHFTFTARSASPSTGGPINLSSDYDLRINGDSAIAWLPYYGRSYAPPLDPTAGGIKFTSTNFSYSYTKKKKTWEITIIPKDVADVKQMYLSVSENGFANLRIVNLNRQPITFTGTVSGH
jgi:hypothetical protein